MTVLEKPKIVNATFPKSYTQKLTLSVVDNQLSFEGMSFMLAAIVLEFRQKCDRRALDLKVEHLMGEAQITH